MWKYELKKYKVIGIADPNPDDIEDTINDRKVYDISPEKLESFIESLLQERRRTSDEWQKLKPDMLVLDPDGWDRSPEGWQYSWFEELITEQEYDSRLVSSTVIGVIKHILGDKE